MGNTLIESSEYDLGSLLVQYRPPLRNLVIGTSIAAVFITGILLMFLVDASTVSSVAVTILLLIGSLLFLSKLVWKTAHHRLLVYEHGVVERNGNHDEVYPWENVLSVKNFLTTSEGTTLTELTLKRQDGKTLRLRGPHKAASDAEDDIPDGAEVGIDLCAHVIEALASESLSQRSIARYQQGERVDFKKFQISRNGIHVGKEILPWSEIEDIEGTAEVLLIRERGKPQTRWTIWITDVPNRAIIANLLVETQPRSFSVVATPDQPVLSGPNERVHAAYRRRRWRPLLISLALCIVPIALIAGMGLYRNYHSTAGRIERATDYLNDGRYAESLALLNEAATYNSDNPVVFATRCAVYREMDLYDLAYEDCNYALELRPDYDYALVSLGRIYYREEQYTRAIAAYNEALTSNPTYAFAFCNRGYSYKKMGDFRTALADFTECFNNADGGTQRNQAIREMQAIYDIIGIPPQ